MTLYRDTSVIVALFTIDALSNRADKMMSAERSVLIVSDFAAAEFTSVIARRHRTGALRAEETEEAFSKFDAWTSRETVRVEISPADLIFATVAMRRLDLPLRAADAIHIAMATPHSAAIATFDRQMAASANSLGVAVVTE